MIFLDTSFLFPLFARHDPDHQRVREVMESYRGKRMADHVLTTKATPTRSTRRAKRPKASTSELDGLRRLIRTVERSLRAEIANLRDELRASDAALAAARLRTLNERQASEGVPRLQADLRVFRDLGIVDERGNRIHREYPADVSEDASDVV